MPYPGRRWSWLETVQVMTHWQLDLWQLQVNQCRRSAQALHKTSSVGHITGPSRSEGFEGKAVGIRAHGKHTHNYRRWYECCGFFLNRNLTAVTLTLKSGRKGRVDKGGYRESTRRQTQEVEWPRRDESERLFLPVWSRVHLLNSSSQQDLLLLWTCGVGTPAFTMTGCYVLMILSTGPLLYSQQGLQQQHVA